MQTVSPYQKRFIAKGKLEGAIETLREGVLEILELRFQLVPADIAEAVQQSDKPSALKKLHRAAVQVATTEEFRSLL